mmetsp:Transcript_8361/g.14374  ORF Transcript_8361/g.14374 Transcript_8361/m.14374 type:complete len:101 (-) Transcript_8361:43-345(-)
MGAVQLAARPSCQCSRGVARLLRGPVLSGEQQDLDANQMFAQVSGLPRPEDNKSATAEDAVSPTVDDEDMQGAMKHYSNSSLDELLDDMSDEDDDERDPC